MRSGYGFRLRAALDRREERSERQVLYIAGLRKRATEADAKLKLLYDAIENGVTDLSDLMLKDRITEQTAIRDQVRADTVRAGEQSDHRHPVDREVCQDRSQANADRGRRLSPRLSSDRKSVV